MCTEPLDTLMAPATVSRTPYTACSRRVVTVVPWWAVYLGVYMVGGVQGGVHTPAPTPAKAA